MAKKQKRRLFGIQGRLLSLVFILFLVPWLGYTYVNEVTELISNTQESALLLNAQAIATVLHGKDELFSEHSDEFRALKSGKSGYTAPTLENDITLDGTFDDWGEEIELSSTLYTGITPLFCDLKSDVTSLYFRQTLGIRDDRLFVAFDVQDDLIVLRDMDLKAVNNSDQLRFTVRSFNGDIRRYLLITQKPGSMSVYLMEEDWETLVTGKHERDIQAYMKIDQGGYKVELRAPRSYASASSQIGFSIVDVDETEGREIRTVMTTAPGDATEQLSGVIQKSPGIAKILNSLEQPWSSIWVVDKNELVRAHKGVLQHSNWSDSESGSDEFKWNNLRTWPLLSSLIFELEELMVGNKTGFFEDYSQATEKRREPIIARVINNKTPETKRRPSVDAKAEVVMAVHPVWSRNKVIGAVIIEQSSSAMLANIQKPLQTTSLIILAVILFIAFALLIFAYRLTMRIGKLRDATEKAITPEGRMRRQKLQFTSNANDEIGDLTRSFSEMLKRQSEYTHYLEAMPDTLAHEIKNPINVINSSLENLEKEIPVVKQSRYQERARNGLQRLGSIMTRFTEAANIEGALNDELRERFNLTHVVSSFADGFRMVHADNQFIINIPNKEIWIDGSADHIGQLLDKLGDNALDFGDPGTAVTIQLDCDEEDAIIQIWNQGPVLPIEIEGRLFEPMVSYRQTDARESHLGLGLYIVRLIAEFHYGRVEAVNRYSPDGVEIRVMIPMSLSRTLTHPRRPRLTMLPDDDPDSIKRQRYL